MSFFPKQIARVILVIVLHLAAIRVQADPVVYPAPDGEPLSDRFTVQVEQKDSPVYIAHVRCIEQIKPALETNGEAAFTSFDIDGRVAVAVTFQQDVNAAKILPSSRGIIPTVSGRQISFSIDAPGQLTLEVNGDWNNSLHLFANPVEANVPRADDPNVIYFGPGVHLIAPMKVGAGKTVYVAGGALVYGKPENPEDHRPVLWLDGANITLRGRGVIDGSFFPKTPHSAARLVSVNGDNVSVEGVTLRDSGSWTLSMWDSKHVKVDNVKIFGRRLNSDGIDIVNSQDVNVSDGFVRTFDDLVVVKSSHPGGQESRDITVRHMVLWNEIAHALSLGAELRQPVEAVRFTDCDIIHDKGREWLLHIFQCDSAPIRDIVFDDIRIEEDRRFASVWIGKAMWSRDDERGHIDGITFRDIRTVAPENNRATEIVGVDPAHAVHDVRFENVTVGGKPLQASSISQNSFVADTKVTP